MSASPSRGRRIAPATREAGEVRGRALDACRRLFNERGVASVTIAQIAASLGMNEGHLHYYFNTKAQIVTALFDAFEARVDQAASHGLDLRDRPDRYADYQRNWFVLMWHYRFIYRDHRGLFRLAPALEGRLSAVSLRAQAQFRRVLDDMVELGLLQAEPAAREALLVNCWIVSSYWIDYLTTLRGAAVLAPADLEQGMKQIDALFAPYLTAKARAAAPRPPLHPLL